MKRLRNSWYHRTLRVTAVVVAAVLLFQSGLLHNTTKNLSQQTNLYLANVIGMSVGVEPTELNTITAELTKQKLALEQREISIKEREIEIGLAAGQSSSEKAIYVLSAILFVLLILIITNYVLDYMRVRHFNIQSTGKLV